MGYINRFLLFLYALAVALAALGVIVLCLPVFPVPAILNETTFLLSRWETIAGAALVFLISVHLVACSLTCGSRSGEQKEKKEAEAVVVRGASGEVRVAIPAVSNMAASTSLLSTISLSALASSMIISSLFPTNIAILLNLM